MGGSKKTNDLLVAEDVWKEKEPMNSVQVNKAFGWTQSYTFFLVVSHEPVLKPNQGAAGSVASTVANKI